MEMPSARSSAEIAASIQSVEQDLFRKKMEVLKCIIGEIDHPEDPATVSHKTPYPVVKLKTITRIKQGENQSGRSMWNIERVYKNDIIVKRDLSVYPFVKTGIEGGLVEDEDMIIVRCSSHGITMKYLHIYLTRYQGTLNGATLDSEGNILHKRVLDEFSVIVPPLDVQEEVVAKLECVLEFITSARAMERHLTTKLAK